MPLFSNKWALNLTILSDHSCVQCFVNRGWNIWVSLAMELTSQPEDSHCGHFDRLPLGLALPGSLNNSVRFPVGLVNEKHLCNKKTFCLHMNHEWHPHSHRSWPSNDLICKLLCSFSSLRWPRQVQTCPGRTVS